MGEEGAQVGRGKDSKIKPAAEVRDSGVEVGMGGRLFSNVFTLFCSP